MSVEEPGPSARVPSSGFAATAIALVICEVALSWLDFGFSAVTWQLIVVPDVVRR